MTNRLTRHTVKSRHWLAITFLAALVTATLLLVPFISYNGGVFYYYGDFNVQEIARVLKPGGLFITQQVGAQNDRELVALLLGDVPLPFPDQTLAITKERFMEEGFSILEEGEAAIDEAREVYSGAMRTLNDAETIPLTDLL